MKTAFELPSVFCTLALLSLSTVVFSQDNPQTDVTDETKCQLILDNEVSQIVCIAILAADRAADEAKANYDPTTVEEDPVELLLSQPASWNNQSFLFQLTKTEKQLPEVFVSAAAEVAFYEWACETGKFAQHKTLTKKLVMALLSISSSAILMEQYGKELTRMGYGNMIISRSPELGCDYDQFYDRKIEYLKRLKEIEALAARSH